MTISSRLYDLIADFEIGPMGDLQGLTVSEARRAWQARHGIPLPRRAVGTLRESGLIRQVQARTCAVTERHLYPWVTSRGLASSNDSTGIPHASAR